MECVVDPSQNRSCIDAVSVSTKEMAKWCSNKMTNLAIINAINTIIIISAPSSPKWRTLRRKKQVSNKLAREQREASTLVCPSRTLLHKLANVCAKTISTFTIAAM